ncbi:ubiquitin 3 binding protein But2 C-terminal domain-containing protein [Xylaria sp. FL0043]|nr:ubiquitin 3 binding protein But2 C-terminal domain-containing protein [Xylaria sp. FL0043]
MLQKSLLLSSALGGAHALVIRQSGCSFHLRTEGAVSAPVVQYSSGQACASNETASTFNVNGGTLTDAQNRGCWWTPPATVMQCDVGQIPESGFSIGCDGTVSFSGQTTFYSCDTGADGRWMIYLQPQPNADKCGEITLHADGGETTPPGGAGSTTPGATPTGGSPGTNGSPNTPGEPSQTGTPSGSCPGTLSGTYQYPHLIIPVDSSNANSAPGTSYYGQVTSTISSAFNFDIPQSYAGKTCTAVFYFPTQDQLQTSSFSFSGSGAIDFSRLSGPVSAATSYANLPEVSQSYGQQAIAPGNAYTLTSFPCPAGESVAFEMSAAQGDSSTNLRYFQDYNPCPIGLYITAS